MQIENEGYLGAGGHSTSKFSARSIRKLKRGGMTVVALYSVTMAGPEKRWPTGIESRGTIWVLTGRSPEKLTGAVVIRDSPVRGERTAAVGGARRLWGSRARRRKVTISTSAAGRL